MEEKINNKPLTIKDFREVMIPAMEKIFVTKVEFIEFANKSLSNQEKILKILEILKQ